MEYRLDDIDDLETLGCTDIQCSWAKETARELYQPIPNNEYCHPNMRNRRSKLSTHLSNIPIATLNTCKTMINQGIA